jgi:putative SOS response-associated peptidase YedK
MCNDYEQQIAWAEYCKLMQALELGGRTQQSETDLPQADHIRINDIGPVMRASGNGIELAQMPGSGSRPQNPARLPFVNFRSEGRNFAKSNRCLIPASAFFEFTGKKYPRAMHRFTLRDASFMAIAGIWREGQDGQSAFTMLTTEPGPDVSPYHNRQVVALRPTDWAAWIYLTRPETELLRPLPAGSLKAETVRQGSD